MIQKGINESDLKALRRTRIKIDKLSWTAIAGLADSVNQEKEKEIQLAKNELLLRLDALFSLNEIELLRSNKYLLQNGVNTISFALLEGDSLFWRLRPTIH